MAFGATRRLLPPRLSRLLGVTSEGRGRHTIVLLTESGLKESRVELVTAKKVVAAASR